MQEQDLLSKIMRGFARDRNLTFSERVRKGVKLVSETTGARLFLRSCDRVGPGARVVGRMRVENRGSIVAGDGLVVISSFVPVELVTGEEGRIEIGNGVWINFGTVIAAQRLVKIGHGVMLGQHCILSDVEIPETAVDLHRDGAKPIEIGDNAWLAGRVTVMPGVTIGAGSVVTAGSVVEGDIPPGVVAGGIPARVLRAVGANGASTKSASASAEALAPLPPVHSAAAPAAPRFSGTLISDFTIDELADELLKSETGVSSTDPSAGSGVRARVAPYGQVAQNLLEPPSGDGAAFTDFAVVWTRPEIAVPSFARTLAFESFDEGELATDVDAFASLLEAASAHYKYLFVPSWTLPRGIRGLGVLDARKGGVTRALWTMNVRLAERLAEKPNIYVLNAERWSEVAGRTANVQKAWYLGKMAVSRPAMAEAAADIKAALFGLTGNARKLLIVDLDDTMWGGIVGDVGWEGLRLGGHDGIGEAFVDFQRALKNLKRRGIVLGIVSKNEESVALEAIRNHPEMILREEDFVAWKINWTDKAKNIAELTAELNLGLQSVVFIDDNPVERARVRDALPEVLVPDWPEDKFLYPSALHRLRCFDAPPLSREDAERTAMYAQERKREELQKQVGSIGEWLKSLQIKVRAEPLGPGNLARAAQLLNKTNQMNLSTRRLTEAELVEWSRGTGRAFFTITVSDRLGDAGLTGLVSIEREGDVAHVVDYVLSCRVMGRKVEETMVHVAVTAAAGMGCSLVVADYLATPKNKPCLSFWLTSGFASEGERRFTWNAREAFALPDAITLDWQRGG